MKPPVFDTSYAQLPKPFFTALSQSGLPRAPTHPKLIKLNKSLAQTMGLDIAWLESEDGLAMLSGGEMPGGVDPVAMVYAGHQFGGWSARLGDGRAALLGEIVTREGLRLDVQLKGYGPTAYSRRGDGKSALGPALREYIVSEAMAAYGVPTTRALAVCMTGEMVVRAEGELPAAVFTRAAQSHVRVGTFQYFFGQNDVENLRILADYILARHYPQADSYADMLKEIVRRQARLVAKWLGLGFIHGVMNTDNMQIAGETIDYGPCAFMDDFHPQKVFSSIDQYGRYAWGQQPSMAFWNLSQLAHALSPILDKDEAWSATLAEGALQVFYPAFQAEMDIVFGTKFGFARSVNIDVFLQKTFAVMTEQKVDFTLFFRRLTQVAAGADSAEFLFLFTDEQVGQDWLLLWRELFEGSAEAITHMQSANPIYIPRNHRIEDVISSALQDNFAPFHRLVGVLANPYTEQTEHSELERAPMVDEMVTQTFCGT